MKLNYTFDGKLDVKIKLPISEILKVTSEMDLAGKDNIMDNIVSSILQELKPEIVQKLNTLKVKKSTSDILESKRKLRESIDSTDSGYW